MVLILTTPNKESLARISIMGEGDFHKVVCDGNYCNEVWLMNAGTSYGFRREETKKGDTKYTLPLQITKEDTDILRGIAEELGDVKYAPVYKISDESSLVYMRVPMMCGVISANIHDVQRRRIHPKEKTGMYMKARVVIRVDSLRVGGEKPKLQLSLVQAELEDSEMVFEDFLGLQGRD